MMFLESNFLKSMRSSLRKKAKFSMNNELSLRKGPSFIGKHIDALPTP
jgi:hypothetical protein